MRRRGGERGPAAHAASREAPTAFATGRAHSRRPLGRRQLVGAPRRPRRRRRRRRGDLDRGGSRRDPSAPPVRRHQPRRPPRDDAGRYGGRIMISLGYKLSSEEHAPVDLVRYAQMAQDAGFRFALISDHYHPWIDRQGQSPFVWSVIGAIAQATQRLVVGTAVTCPTMRI